MEGKHIRDAQGKKTHRDINAVAIGRSKDTITTGKGNRASLKRKKKKRQ